MKTLNFWRTKMARKLKVKKIKLSAEEKKIIEETVSVAEDSELKIA